MINRRRFLSVVAGAAVMLGGLRLSVAQAIAKIIEPITKTDAEWKALLSPEAYDVLRQEGTEHPFTSPLNHEKRKGIFQCAGCELDLFSSECKFDSGTGWPSFYDFIKGHIKFKTDEKLIIKRTEYHCARCGGHHGHVFNDGPKPTGLRYCNNGVALKFIPESQEK